ncbi:hypothetical protein [Zhongshania sp.]|uniref:hypothetical protein n=1 Tax=Zhongshania sp. TaxID=1971902 RepID=UPI0039E304F1
MKLRTSFSTLSLRAILAMPAILTGMTILVPAASASTCNADTPISAHYQISKHTADTKPEQFDHMVLWRRANSVAEQYPKRAITELWERNRSNSIKLNRYFDAYQRGIEYAPGEIKDLGGDDNWSMKNQLVANSLLAKMTLIKTIGSGCDREEIYTLKDLQQSITLNWLPAYRLVKSYTRNAKGQTSTWLLTAKSTDTKVINVFFEQHLNYQTTDYADIGDNESDPFLRKMINLGFIEHGSSGMYDAQGNDIGGEHHH